MSFYPTIGTALAAKMPMLDVLSNTFRVAHIGKEKFSITAGGGEYWNWNMTIDRGPSGYTVHGGAGSLTEAMAAVERNWQTFLSAAGLKEE